MLVAGIHDATNTAYPSRCVPPSASKKPWASPLRGDEETAQQLLDEAHGWVADDRHGDARGGYGSFCTTGYIEVHRASCLTLLRPPKRAITHYEQALPASTIATDTRSVPATTSAKANRTPRQTP
jgi:hypothetical protein